MLSLSQLKTLKIKNDGQNYQRPIRVKLIGIGDEVSYINARKEKKQLWNLVVADESNQTVKGVLYSRDLRDELIIGQSYVIRNFIIKPDKKEKGNFEIVLTRAAKIGKCSEIAVRQETAAKATELLQMPTSAVLPIRDIKKSPVKARVSVEGKVIQEDAPTTVDILGEDVPIKRIVIDDSTDCINLTLWRQQSNSNIAVGNYVRVTNTTVNHHNNENKINTTQSSVIEIIEQPPQQTKLRIIAVDNWQEFGARLFCEDETGLYMTRYFKSSILREIFTVSDENEIVQKLPKDVVVKEKDGDILEVDQVIIPTDEAAENELENKPN